MAKYFGGFTRDANPTQGLSSKERIAVGNQHTLPFNDLSPRLFEVLCYRLKKKQHPEAQVDLMQGTNDGGRDVVVYRHGQLVEIIQCKNQKERMRKPNLLEELCKIALLYVREQDVIQTPLRYEVWCPPGFGQPAAEIMGRWPQKWTEREVKPHIQKLLRTTRSTSLSWSTIKDVVLRVFPKFIQPHKEESLDITERVKEHQDIYDDFFTATRVIPQDQLRTELRGILADGNFHQLSTPELKHIVNRIESFHPDEAMRLFYTYVFGIRPDFVALMNTEELKEFYRILEGRIAALSKIIISVGIRRAFSIINTHISKLVDPHPSFLYALIWLIKFRAYVCSSISTGAADLLQSDLREFSAAGQEGQISMVLTHIWELCNRSTTNELHADDLGAIRKIRAEFDSQESFERRTWAAFRANEDLVSAVLHDSNTFMPKQLIVVSDCLSVLSADNSPLVSFGKTMDALADARRRSGSG